MSEQRTKPPSSSPQPRMRSSSRRRTTPPSVDTSVTQELAAQLKPGPKSAQALVAAGITSLAELRSLGSVVAYTKVKQQTPQATLNLLWALEGALSSLPWQTIAHEHRTSLLLALEQHQKAAKPYHLHRSRLHNVAMVSDFYVAAVLLCCLVAIERGL